MPLVSVVIPTKGRPVQLARAIGTILEQTISDLEVIVVTAPESLVRYYAEEDRMSKKMRGLEAERAFSGFCLAIGAHRAVQPAAAVPGQFLS